jgi:hypothetical protein
MKEALKTLAGLSLASLYRGGRFGWSELLASSRRTVRLVAPLESADLRAIPVVPPESLLHGQSVEITHPVEAYVDGSLTTSELVALLALAVRKAPRAVLEIGTFMGQTTRLLAANLPGATIHTLDLPTDFSPGPVNDPAMPKDDFHLIRQRQPGRAFVSSPDESRIRQHYGDSASWDFKAAVGANFFFIDGSHTYEYCRNDSEKCFELCAGRGTFVWHDCNAAHPGVTRLLAEWRRQGRDVVRIVDTALGYWDNAG